MRCTEMEFVDVLPDESILNASTPPSENAIVSAAGNHIPVLRSPVVVIEGSKAVPAPAATVPVTSMPVALVAI
jgi:hypothetical protein